MSSDVSWYVRIRGRVQGPFSTDKLLAMRNQGRVSRVHELSTDGVSWRVGSTYDEIFPAKEDAFSLEEVEEPDQAAEPNTSSPPQSAEHESQWHYARKGQQFGPIPFAELKRMVESGLIHGDDKVWHEGISQWTLASSIPSLGVQTFVPTQHHGEVKSDTPPPRTSGLAIASLILGIFGFCTLITSIIAVVFAHVALHNIYRSRGQLDGKGLAVAGLILGWLSLFMWLAVGILQLNPLKNFTLVGP